jgi:hypothetical protein
MQTTVTKLDYTYFRREIVDLVGLRIAPWTALIASYNSSPRVQAIWDAAPSTTMKLWAIHKEYRYLDAELPQGACVRSDGLDEASFLEVMLAKLGELTGRAIQSERLAIDLTGFMRPELVFFVRALALRRVGPVDFLYSEPVRYRHKAWTRFSKGNVTSVRQVVGCEGVHEPESGDDLLVIGTGYDDVLMSAVAEHKPNTRKALMMGLPSLAPDMYQENVWRVSRSSESIGAAGYAATHETLFAPANDPFVTASVVSDYLSRVATSGTNVYLAPLGTKVQALGFALYYAAECAGRDVPVSMLLPFSEQYDRETSHGVGRIWRFEVDFRSWPAL